MRSSGAMGLTSVTGVFSRYFVVGFFLPAYIALVSLWFAATSAFVPNELERYKPATQLLILGGLALVAGLALSGVSYYLTRLLEGYPLERTRTWRFLNVGYRAALGLQRRSFDRLRTIRDDESQADNERARAARLLDRSFPHAREALLPTRLGNALRAFERHSNTRWGLDGVTVWPRIEALLGADERELHVDAKINFYVFMNGAVSAVAAGVCLVVDEAVHTPETRWGCLLYVLPFLVGYVLYRAALGPASDWGDCVRSSIDLHRLELYEKLGVRTPTSFSDERGLAERVNQTLLFGEPFYLPDDLWHAEAGDQAPESTLFALLKRIEIGG